MILQLPLCANMNTLRPKRATKVTEKIFETSQSCSIIFLITSKKASRQVYSQALKPIAVELFPGLTLLQNALPNYIPSLHSTELRGLLTSRGFIELEIFQKFISEEAIIDTCQQRLRARQAIAFSKTMGARATRMRCACTMIASGLL